MSGLEFCKAEDFAIRLGLNTDLALNFQEEFLAKLMIKLVNENFFPEVSSSVSVLI